MCLSKMPNNIWYARIKKKKPNQKKKTTKRQTHEMNQFPFGSIYVCAYGPQRLFIVYKWLQSCSEQWRMVKEPLPILMLVNIPPLITAEERGTTVVLSSSSDLLLVFYPLCLDKIFWKVIVLKLLEGLIPLYLKYMIQWCLSQFSLMCKQHAYFGQGIHSRLLSTLP